MSKSKTRGPATPKAAEIRILSASLNPHHAECYGCVFKLTYVLEARFRPRLEIFTLSGEAVAGDWDVYGGPTEIVTQVRFSHLADIQIAVVEGRSFRIEFTGVEDQPYVYQRTGPTTVPEYTFKVEPIDH